jgi:ABC-type transport system involved in cytochrome c biogenesis ATPase subunit
MSAVAFLWVIPVTLWILLADVKRTAVLHASLHLLKMTFANKIATTKIVILTTGIA